MAVHAVMVAVKGYTLRIYIPAELGTVFHFRYIRSSKCNIKDTNLQRFRTPVVPKMITILNDLGISIPKFVN